MSWAGQFWPFREPDGGLLKDAGRAMYWSGVSHGVLAALLGLSVLVLLWWLWRTDNVQVRVGILSVLLAVILWYASLHARRPEPEPAPAPPAKPKRPHWGDERTVSCADWRQPYTS